MNKKSFLSVKWTLIIVIIIILVIGLIGTVQLFFPWLEKGFSCIQLQRSNIDEVITVIEEVLLTGEEQIIRFRVEKCTECIWYNDEDPDHPKLEVEYETSSESFFVPSQIAWTGIDTASGCPWGYLVGTEGRKTCTIDITVSSVLVEC